MQKIIIALLATLLLMVAGASGADAESTQQKDWISETILNELIVIRQEVGALRRELQTLKTELRQGRSANQAAASGAMTQLTLDSKQRLGDANATIGLVEFTDYQCPFCVRHANGVFSNIKEKWVDTGKLQYFLRDFPLDIHPQGRSAAIAAYCAGEQNQYWPMRDNLFANSRFLTKGLYLTAAKNLQLNTASFDRCLNSDVAGAAIDADVNLGKQLAIQGTPKFYIGRVENGMLVDIQVITGAQSLQTFERVFKELQANGA